MFVSLHESWGMVCLLSGCLGVVYLKVQGGGGLFLITVWDT
jgi:hypothetical protein